MNTACPVSRSRTLSPRPRQTERPLCQRSLLSARLAGHMFSVVTSLKTSTVEWDGQHCTDYAWNDPIPSGPVSRATFIMRPKASIMSVIDHMACPTTSRCSNTRVACLRHDTNSASAVASMAEDRGAAHCDIGHRRYSNLNTSSDKRPVTRCFISSHHVPPLSSQCTRHVGAQMGSSRPDRIPKIRFCRYPNDSMRTPQPGIVSDRYPGYYSMKQ
jgi:hypothetical protein